MHSSLIAKILHFRDMTVPMRSMLLSRIVSLKDQPNPLQLIAIPKPSPSHDEVLIKVSVCGVCHTELDEIEGRTPPPTLPIVLGHQVVGIVEETGDEVKKFKYGDRLGVAWIFSACGACNFCKSGQENLCAAFRATGRDANGGYADYMCVKEDFAYPIPDIFSDAEAAPLLCAGAIGYRSLRLTQLQNGQTLGLTGFGASAHLVLKMATHQYPDSDIYVFARSEKEREFGRQLGATWAGDTTDTAPALMDAIIDTTPVWKPVIEALAQLKPGGRLVVNAIRKESIDQEYLLRLHYPTHLWMEKEIKSVANVTRQDVTEFLALASEIPIKPEYREYPLDQANVALRELKEGKIRGAKVLRVS
ncbi:MAG TPA: zinc-dependent alcohol dehydrogenase family protein [Saprospiraceae bacterium]|nr:zinc-dependent alcohol dehydrogenase family protein [Saprospiraceae bacterium]